MNRAVFLDRDGTLIVEKKYLSDPAQRIWIPGVPPALRCLQEAGFLLFVVTNQSGIGRGYYTVADMERVHARLSADLGQAGVYLRKIYFAPEAPDQPSRGRKPSPQFLWDARDEFGLDLSASYMIGDKRIDLECGWNAGIKRCVLVRSGYGAETERTLGADRKAWVADDLAGAVGLILAHEGSNAPASTCTSWD
jgi:D-glycero-D-manno-heptose 1,7-bisphosphate phosphatase